MLAFYEGLRISTTILLTNPVRCLFDIDTLKNFMHLRRCYRHADSPRQAPSRWIEKRARLQPFHAQPETTILPHQGFQPAPIPAQEDETIPGIGILPELADHR
jgi:hypothetical protein